MNLSDVRELLWVASFLYGASFLVGVLKTRYSLPVIAKESSFLLITAGFFIQTRALYLRGIEVHGCPLGNGLERTQFILWSLIIAYLLLRLLWHLNLLGTFCAGVSFAFGILSLSLQDFDHAYWTASGYERLFKDPWIELHASIAIFSYGLFCLLTVVSLMYLSQRRALLSRKPAALGSFLPPIQELEKAGLRLLLIGVCFLTLSIIVGTMHWTRHPEFVSHLKLGVTIALWIGYIALLTFRLINLLYGSNFAKCSIGLFVLAIISLSLVNSTNNKSDSKAKSSLFHFASSDE